MDRIDHIAIAVEDIGEALEWYKNQFTCAVAYQDDTWALLEFDNTNLALVLEEQHPGHFAVEREDATRFGKLKTHRDQTQSVYISDPWKNSIEIMQKNIHE